MNTATHATESLVFSTLLQLVVMIAAARIMGTLFRRMGQPAATGEIIAGLMLGPSLLGALAPDLSVTIFGAKPSEAITILSQIGLILLMFQIGVNFEFSHIARADNRRRLALVTLVSVAVPFALGVGFGLFSAPVLAPGINVAAYALFCGVALAITAVPILGRILQEFGLNRDETGVLAISAAALNDVIGWVMLASVAAFAHGGFTASGLAWQLGGLVVFGIGVVLLGPLVVRLILRLWPLQGGLLAPNMIAAVLVVIFVLGMATYALGIFAIFGGFVAGLLFHRDHAFAKAWADQIGRLVLVFFLPVFFTFTGLRTNLLGLNSLADLGWLALILVLAVGGKILPVYLAGRASGITHHRALMLGTLMNTRALMELIVLNIGYELGVIPQKVFTMLVIMAVVTTLMTGPLLRRILRAMGRDVGQTVEA